MKGQETRRYLKNLRRPRPPAENTWATEAAAETLEANGHIKDAQLVRDQIGPNAANVAMDPMEFWILMEDAE
jgi:hypothetical protein